MALSFESLRKKRTNTKMPCDSTYTSIAYSTRGEGIAFALSSLLLKQVRQTRNERKINKTLTEFSTHSTFFVNQTWAFVFFLSLFIAWHIQPTNISLYRIFTVCMCVFVYTCELLRTRKTLELRTHITSLTHREKEERKQRTIETSCFFSFVWISQFPLFGGASFYSNSRALT